MKQQLEEQQQKIQLDSQQQLNMKKQLEEQQQQMQKQLEEQQLQMKKQLELQKQQLLEQQQKLQTTVTLNNISSALSSTGINSTLGLNSISSSKPPMNINSHPTISAANMINNCIEMNTLNTDMTSLIHTINTGNTITTTTTASPTDPFYVRPPIGHKPVPSILDGPNVDPAMLNWRTRERQ